MPCTRCGDPNCIDCDESYCVVCAWCGVVIEGDPRAPRSHGICGSPECRARFRGESMPAGPPDDGPTRTV